MLTIRSEQLHAFEAAARAAFEDRMVRQLAFEDKDAAEALVRRTIRKCLGYGIEMESDIEEFLWLTVRYSQDFEAGMPWAMEILKSEDLAAATKIRILLRKLGRRRSAPLPLSAAARA